MLYELNALRAALSWAERQSKAKKKPFDRLVVAESVFDQLQEKELKSVLLAGEPVTNPDRLSDEEIGRICDALPFPYRPVVRFAVLTGMRLNEVVGLRWNQIHENGAVPLVRPTRTKAKKPREVPLCRQALALLPSRPVAGGLVFLGQRGGRLNNLPRAWRKARIKAKLPRARFHDLRHEWASRYIENGGDLRSLQEIGGWSDLKLVERYSHPTIARALEVMERATARGVVVEFPGASGAQIGHTATA